MSGKHIVTGVDPLATYSSHLHTALTQFQEWLRVHQYSEAYVAKHADHGGRFVEWCEARSVTLFSQVSRALLERYQRHLFHYRKENGKPLSAATQHGHLTTVKSFLRWAARQHLVDVNPAAELVMPRRPHRMPRDVLSPREVETVLNAVDITDVGGIRDRAILEVFYSTGIRRAELAHLLIHDVDQERGTVMIREGKGSRDRMVPIGSRAIAWVEKYLVESRPHLVVEPDPQVLFLSKLGGAMGLNNLSSLARGYVVASGIGKRGSCHIFRHSVATAMLDGGADIRFIQALLGHVSLETTSIYTRVAIGKLKEIHTATHPAESGARVKTADAAGVDRAKLLDGLAQEAEEEITVRDEDVVAMEDV